MKVYIPSESEFHPQKPQVKLIPIEIVLSGAFDFMLVDVKKKENNLDAEVILSISLIDTSKKQIDVLIT